jgi:hypothetical protein
LRTQTVALSGTGIAAPALAVSPTSLSFSGQTAGRWPASPQTLTVSNTGGAPLANVGFQITGHLGGQFLDRDDHLRSDAEQRERPEQLRGRR